MIIEKCWKLIRFPSGGNDGSRFYSRNISPQKNPGRIQSERDFLLPTRPPNRAVWRSPYVLCLCGRFPSLQWWCELTLVLSKGKTAFQVVCRDLHVAVFLVQDFDHAVVPEGGEAEFSAAFQAEGNVFDIRGQTVG